MMKVFMKNQSELNFCIKSKLNAEMSDYEKIVSESQALLNSKPE
jgi:hypothetical protein